jgi:hypothetical protein
MPKSTQMSRISHRNADDIVLLFADESEALTLSSQPRPSATPTSSRCWKNWIRSTDPKVAIPTRPR